MQNDTRQIERFSARPVQTPQRRQRATIKPMTHRHQSERTAINLAALLLGVVVWLVPASLPAQQEAAAQPPAAPAKPSTVKDVTPEQAEALLKANTNIVVLDIRTPEEFAAGHLAGATNVNFNAANFAEILARLDQSKPYLLHCASGRRSTSCLPQLEKLQFTNVYHLKTGIGGWQRAGKPVAK